MNEHNSSRKDGMKEFFGQMNQFFDKVFVITLRRATDRHAHIQRELDGLHYELFFGRDKQDFTVEQLEREGIYNEALARKHHRYGKAMPPGMIGCSWSHAEVYKTILNEGHQKVLILEDDVVIDKNAVAVWGDALTELPAGWELLYLGFAEKETVPPMALLKKAVYHLQHLFGGLNYSHTTIRNLYPKKIGRYVSKAGYHDCTHAYGLTRSGAEKLLRLQTPISFFPDNLLAHAATNELVKAYIIQPKIINQQYQVGTTSVSYINQ
ncbi:MAG TPA: glycosyltransferase family 25 protein [Flavisolibacter sp.]|jgi:glycosyl transferase family 25|nr:glycosyltransferase family 25 protein [Flavisolibacter sp.]